MPLVPPRRDSLCSDRYQCAPRLYNFLCIQQQQQQQQQNRISWHEPQFVLEHSKLRYSETTTHSSTEWVTSVECSATCVAQDVLLAYQCLNVPWCKYTPPTESFLKWESLCAVTDINVLLCAGNQASESSDKEVPKNVRPPSPPTPVVLLPPLPLQPPLVAASPVCGLHTHYSLHTGQVTTCFEPQSQ